MAKEPFGHEHFLFTCALRLRAVAGAAAPRGQFIQKGGKSETLAGIWNPAGMSDAMFSV